MIVHDQDLKEHSPILQDLLKWREIKISGAVYNISTGAVNFLYCTLAGMSFLPQPAQDNCQDNLHPSTFKKLIIPFQVHDQAPDSTGNREDDSPGCLNYPGG